MRADARRDFHLRVERKVFELRASGVAPKHLELGVLAALEAGLPLRDAIVLREARRCAERESPRARAAWDQARAALKASVPDSTWRIWLEPIEVVGEEGEELLLAAPTGIRAWAERRYAGLIRRAVDEATDLAGVRFAAILLPELAEARS